MEFQSTLQSWVADLNRKAAPVHLGQAWLGSAIVDYTVFRLRYFVLGTVLGLCLHIVEFYLLTKIFTDDSFHIVALFRLGSLALQAWWWGGLEVLRDEVKQLHGRLNAAKLAVELGFWRRLSFLGCAVLVLCAAYFVVMACVTTGTARIGNFYIAAILASLGLRIILETKKACVYARSRIWRPFWAIVVPPVLYLVLMSALWFWIGEATIVVVMVVTSISSFLMSRYFITKVERNLELSQPIWRGWKRFKALFARRIISKKFFGASFGFLAIDIVGLMVAAIGLVDHVPILSTSPFVLFYFLNPLFKASGDWTSLFYFDLKKFQGAPLEAWLGTLTQKILLFSPVVGLFFWCIAMMCIAGFFKDDVYTVGFGILIFFIYRSSIALLQMVAYCQARYVAVIFSGALLFLSFFAMVQLQQTSMMLAALLASLTLGALVVWKPWLSRPLSKVPLPKQGFLAWLSWLRTETRSMQGWYLEVPADLSRQQKQILFQMMFGKTICNHSAWFWVDKTHVFGATIHADLKQTFIKTVARQAGLVSDYKLFQLDSDPDSRIAMFLSFLDRSTDDHLHHRQSVASLVERFKTTFPEGWYHDGSGMTPIQAQVRAVRIPNYHASLLAGINHFFLSPNETGKEKELSISAAATDERGLLVFVIPLSHENVTAAMHWKKAIFLWNVQQFCQNKVMRDGQLLV